MCGSNKIVSVNLFVEPPTIRRRPREIVIVQGRLVKDCGLLVPPVVGKVLWKYYYFLHREKFLKSFILFFKYIKYI